jgi:hypothetical protein
MTTQRSILLRQDADGNVLGPNRIGQGKDPGQYSADNRVNLGRTCQMKYWLLQDLGDKITANIDPTAFWETWPPKNSLYLARLAWPDKDLILSQRMYRKMGPAHPALGSHTIWCRFWGALHTATQEVAKDFSGLG